MKYINKFTNISDYHAFKERDGYVTPNVNYIENSGIILNPYIKQESKIITFYISLGATKYIYYAEENMTWEEWANSSYNNDFNITCYENYIILNYNGRTYCSEGGIKKSTIIKNENLYYFSIERPDN